jgi:hypothetical protein
MLTIYEAVPLSMDGMAIIGIMLALALVLVGIISRQRIYNLLSIGAFVFCGIIFMDHMALVLTFVGLILWQIYYVFFAEYK